jgi:hypothetical protein
MRKFETIGKFTFDIELVKGWFIEDSLGSLEDDLRMVRNCVVLYDCFQIPVPDPDQELEKYLSEKLLKG